MKSNQKFISGVLLGMVAGAGIALFLKSDKGKQTIASAKATADSWGSDIKNKLQSLEKDISALINKGRAVTEEVEQTGTV